MEARSLITSAIVNVDDLVRYDLWVQLFSYQQ